MLPVRSQTPHSPTSRWRRQHRRPACDLGGRQCLPLVVPGEAVQVADRERLGHVALPAALLAQARTHAPQRRRQREVIHHDFGGPLVIA